MVARITLSAGSRIWQGPAQVTGYVLRLLWPTVLWLADDGEGVYAEDEGGKSLSLLACLSTRQQPGFYNNILSTTI